MTLTARTVTGVVQGYHWGDTDFIPRLLGREPDGTPHAELWLGTHGNGQTVFDDGTPLSAVTGELPYLLKVLAAAEPLSLQDHPTREQANDGYRRGVYRDANEKPELLCALTRFEAFCGVRPVEDTLHLLRHIGARELAGATGSETDSPEAAASVRARAPSRPPARTQARMSSSSPRSNHNPCSRQTSTMTPLRWP